VDQDFGELNRIKDRLSECDPSCLIVEVSRDGLPKEPLGFILMIERR